MTVCRSWEATVRVVSVYKTKTQKKNALKAMEQKSVKLLLSGVITIAEATAITKVVKAGMKRL